MAGPKRRRIRIADTPKANGNGHTNGNGKAPNLFEKLKPGGLRRITEAGPGRPPGSPNYMPAMLKKLVMMAADQVGQDMEGKDGILGYLRHLAINHPHTYASLLRRVMPVQVRADVDPEGLLGRLLASAQAQKSIAAPAIDVTPNGKDNA